MKRVDANQPAIVSALRQVGATVHVTSMIGNGFPDIVVGYRGTTFLFEIKDGQKVMSKRQLTGDEQIWHANWQGHVAIVESIEDALQKIGAI